MTSIQEYLGIPKDLKDNEYLISFESLKPEDKIIIEEVVKECAAEWNWPYQMALDYMMIHISKTVLQKEKTSIQKMLDKLQKELKYMKMDSTQLENIWFTADSHFGHENIIKFCNRPFESIDEMDKKLIDNYNEVVKPGDTVYHLGDFTLGGWEYAEKYFTQLNGHIKFLSNPWHHDKRWLYDLLINVKDPYQEYYYGKVITNKDEINLEILPPMVVLEIDGMGASQYPLAITLCHYPLQEWDRKNYGAWHLCAHTHVEDNSGNFVLNVGVDCMNYYPISLGGVLQCMYEIGHV